jgi:Bacterial capsule synthesis protein PGA_cap
MSEHPTRILLATGDLGPERDDAESLFTAVRGELNAGDIVFGQLEMNLTERGVRMPQARHTARTSPAAAGALRRAGFTAISWAGNHCMDWGPDGFFDTIDALSTEDITVLGVGADIAGARAPRVVDGVAFLAYCSILPAYYWATETRPGCAPLRAHTLYEQIEPDQPGTPARVRTWADPDDLAALLDDIARARTMAATVVVSLHWGIHFVPAAIADYQREVAHAAIDAGADLILGHHAHILKGIEVYRGRAIFYSLGNFAMDLPMTEEHANRPSFKAIQALHPGWEVDLDSSYNFPHDSRKTIVVRCELDGDRIRSVGFRPAYIDRMSRPELLSAGDPRFAEVCDYLSAVGADQGLHTRLAVRGDLVDVPDAAGD